MKIDKIVEIGGERIDKYLADSYAKFSRSEIEDFINKGQVKINSRIVKKSYRLKAGDRITGEIQPQDNTVYPENKPLKILYEDRDLAAVHKPKNLVVHPTKNQRTNTLVNRLLFHFTDLSTCAGNDRPGIVHRLDKDTTGILLIAKNNKTHERLKKMFKERVVEKRYLALCHGRTDSFFIIDTSIGRHPVKRVLMQTRSDGKPALTKCKTIIQNEEYSLVDVNLYTGRTHQIRVHLASIHHPIVGDPLYGRKKERISVSSQMLHSYALEFNHPITGERIRIIDPPNSDFIKIIHKAGLTVPERFFRNT